MSKCDDCPVRKVYARLFDMHWMGADDCPVECKEGEDDANGLQTVPGQLETDRAGNQE